MVSIDGFDVIIIDLGECMGVVVCGVLVELSLWLMIFVVLGGGVVVVVVLVVIIVIVIIVAISDGSLLAGDVYRDIMYHILCCDECSVVIILFHNEVWEGRGGVDN